MKPEKKREPLFSRYFKSNHYPIESMYANIWIYMVTFTINIPPMLAYIPYMDPMGYGWILATEWSPSKCGLELPPGLSWQTCATAATTKHRRAPKVKGPVKRQALPQITCPKKGELEENMGVSENSVPLNPMVLLIIIPFLNGYFIGNINPTFSDKPILIDSNLD